MTDGVFFFRLVDVPSLAEHGWAALSSARRLYVVDRADGVPAQARPSDAEWRAIERELSASLSTRCLPTSSAIHRALVPETSTSWLGVQYVAYFPLTVVPSSGAASVWLKRLQEGLRD